MTDFSPDFSKVTELPESLVLPIQVSRAYHRYRFATSFCEGKDVLEVACGGGQGLGLLSRKAKRVVGGDLEKKNLAHARKTYQGRANIDLIEIDANRLDFPDLNFDVVLLYEAIYYLENPEQFLKECRRVLRPGGKLILCTANKNWPDFNPSPFSHHYFSVPELDGLLRQEGFSPQFFGAFPDHSDGLKGRLRSQVKRLAVQLGLMPRTMKGKVLLKRLFFGGLVRLPRELSEGAEAYCASYEDPTPLPADRIDKVHTALYVVAALSSPL